jgi:hypothetical protein
MDTSAGQQPGESTQRIATRIGVAWPRLHPHAPKSSLGGENSRSVVVTCARMVKVTGSFWSGTVTWEGSEQARALCIPRKLHPAHTVSTTLAQCVVVEPLCMWHCIAQLMASSCSSHLHGHLKHRAALLDQVPRALRQDGRARLEHNGDGERLTRLLGSTEQSPTEHQVHAGGNPCTMLLLLGMGAANGGSSNVAACATPYMAQQPSTRASTHLILTYGMCKHAAYHTCTNPKSGEKVK